MSDAGSSSITVPEGFTLHTENTSHILISSKEEAFLNPVQEFNRDLSVACIRVWSEELNREKEAKWKQAQERRAKREAGGEAETGQQKKAKSEHFSREVSKVLSMNDFYKRNLLDRAMFRVMIYQEMFLPSEVHMKVTNERYQ
jgi:tRNA G26 N,N-dimethylase Trm1